MNEYEANSEYSKLRALKPNFGTCSTAIYVALARTYTDIPFSNQIFDILSTLKNSQYSRYIPFAKQIFLPQRVPFFEARYKLIDKLIYQSGINHIIEIASGLSPRSLNMTLNRSIEYIEIDLPEMIDEKTRIIKAILPQDDSSSMVNLKLYAGNALDRRQLMRAISRNSSGPIAIITEGLLRYLTREEQTTLSSNIHHALGTFGGIWLTSDIETRSVTDATTRNRRRLLSRLTRTNIEQNIFEDTVSAMEFFYQCGFNVHTHPFTDIIQYLVSPSLLGITEDTLLKEIGHRVVLELSRQNNTK